jgi:hypothetical protein
MLDNTLVGGHYESEGPTFDYRLTWAPYSDNALVLGPYLTPILYKVKVSNTDNRGAIGLEFFFSKFLNYFHW